MKSFFKQIFSPKVLLAFAVAFVAVQLVTGDVCWAQGITTTATNTNVGEENDTLKAFAKLLSVFVNVLTFLAILILNYGGDLLGTEYLTSPLVMETITSLWVTIRNITNIGFVIVLLFLAFSNLVSSLGTGSGWTIKEKLPKVIIGLIAINFSLLGFKILIDTVNVGTTAVLAIPQTTLENSQSFGIKNLLESGVDSDDYQRCMNPTDGEDPKDKCVKFYARVNNLFCEGGDPRQVGPRQEGEELDKCMFYIDIDEVADVDPNSQMAHNLFLAFGVHFQGLEQLPALAANMGSWSEVVTNVLFSAIMVLAYIVALVAIFLALIVRMVALWIFMVFSPLLVAGAILGFGGGKLTGKAVTYLIMPIKIAAAFAVSFVMISAVIDFIPEHSLNFMVFGPSLSQFGKGGYGILWQVATILIFWKVAFWAVEGTEAQFLIDKVKSGAENLGGMAARALTIDRQIFRVQNPNGKEGEKVPVTLGAIFKAGTSFVKEYKSDQSERETAALEAMGIIDTGAKDFKNALNTLSNTTITTAGDLANGVHDMLQKVKVKNVQNDIRKNDLFEVIEKQTPEKYKDRVRGILQEEGIGKLSEEKLLNIVNRINQLEGKEKIANKGDYGGSESTVEKGYAVVTKEEGSVSKLTKTGGKTLDLTSIKGKDEDDDKIKALNKAIENDKELQGAVRERIGDVLREIGVTPENYHMNTKGTAVEKVK